MINSGNLKEYINWLKEKRQKTLDLIPPGEWQDRINELELSSADLESCRKLSEQHIRNARKDEHNNLWEEAEREWNQALTLDPANPEKLVYLADAYYRHFVHTSQFEFIDTSRRLLRKGTKAFPGSNKIRSRLSRINRAIRKIRGNQRVFISFIIMLIMIVLAIAFRGPLTIFLKQWQKTEIPSAINEEEPQPKLTTGPVRTNILNRSDKNLQVIIAESSIQVSSNAYSYTLNGTVSHSSKKITKLVLQQSWYSHDDQLLFRKILPLVDEKKNQYFRKGDNLPFSDFIHETQVPDSLAYVQLTVLDLKVEDDNETIEMNSRNIIWQQERPEGFNVSFRQRESRFVQGSLNDFYQTVFILKNEGRKAINNLEIYPVWFGPENRIIPIGGMRQSVSDKEKALEAGESRTLVYTFQFQAGNLDPGSSENFSISIRNID